MSIRSTIFLTVALGVVLIATIANAEETVSDYLRDGWDIKAVTQTSANGYTQLILQKGSQVMICTLYYTVADNKWGWLPKGCDLVP